MWGGQSCPQPAFSRLDPLESGSAAKIGCPTVDRSLLLRSSRDTILVLAPQVTLRRLPYSAVHQQPIILGVPNQLLALRRSTQRIHEFRLPAFKDYLVLVHIILRVL